MKRRVIEIDEAKCNGCGICADACHEGAISMVDGKAKLMRDDYCDGLGDCLPTCPTQAISFIEREAAPYDELAVLAHQTSKKPGNPQPQEFHGCPGSQSRSITHAMAEVQAEAAKVSQVDSYLSQWPIQIQLAPVNAPYFNGAKLLVAADCTAFSRTDFHERFIKNHVTLIGCPKLDPVNYADKLTEIIANNDIKSVSVVRMEVPCCGGIEMAVKTALQNSNKMIPWQVVTIGIDGRILD